MFKLKNKKSKCSLESGMTLVEVMASIGIVGILSAVAIVSLSSSKNSAELETAAEEVVSILREAQNYSLTGKNLEPGCSNYAVDFTAGSSELKVHNGSGCQLDQTYSLKNGVTVLTAGDTNFSAPHASITIATRTVIQKNSKYYTICVNTAGLVRKLNGNVTCP